VIGADRTRLPDVGPDPAFRFPRIARHALENGLQVRTVEHHTMPVVSLVLVVEAGAVTDPRGREGLAAITADMLDEGTGDLTAIGVSEGFASIGAEYDVDVGPDATAFTLTTLTRFAEQGAALFSEVLLRPALRETDFERVRQLRVDRLRQLKDVPPAVAERAFLRMMYGEHPYGHLSIGHPSSLEALALEDVARFYAGRFHPSRATAVVAGPLPHDGLLQLAAGAFASWKDGEPDPIADTNVPATARGARLSVIPREAAPQSELRIGHLAAPRNSPDYPALLVMNALLGGQFVSRINLKLREEKGYTYGARTGFDWRRGMAPFSLQASVHTAATADAINDSLTELDGIRGSRPPTPEEMSLAKASLTRGYPRGFETVSQVARAVAQLALYELPDTYFEEFVPKVNAIDGADVVRVAEKYIDPSRAVTLVVGDYNAIAESLRALPLGDPQVLPPDM
jgi:predicted Zn-dependent peptidase